MPPHAGAPEPSTWSTRSAASLNDVDTDQQHATLAGEEGHTPIHPRQEQDHGHNADERTSAGWLVTRRLLPRAVCVVYSCGASPREGRYFERLMKSTVALASFGRALVDDHVRQRVDGRACDRTRRVRKWR